MFLIERLFIWLFFFVFVFLQSDAQQDEAVAHLAEMIKGNTHIVEIKYVSTITMIAFPCLDKTQLYTRTIIIYTHQFTYTRIHTA